MMLKYARKLIFKHGFMWHDKSRTKKIFERPSSRISIVPLHTYDFSMNSGK